MKLLIIAIAAMFITQAAADEPKKAWAMLVSYKSASMMALYQTENLCKAAKALASKSKASVACVPYLTQ